MEERFVVKVTMVGRKSMYVRIPADKWHDMGLTRDSTVMVTVKPVTSLPPFPQLKPSELPDL